MKETIKKLLRSSNNDDMLIGLNMFIRLKGRKTDIFIPFINQGGIIGKFERNGGSGYESWIYYHNKRWGFYVNEYTILLGEHPHPHRAGWKNIEL